MLTTTKTRSGWVLKWDGYSRYYQALVQGAIRGRAVLYKRETLAIHGIEYKADPGGAMNEHGVTRAQWLAERVEPDRVLSHGYRVQ